MTKHCSICKRWLNNPKDPFSEDCGGDCLLCMADCQDPEPAAFKAGFLAAVEMIRDKEDKYGIGNMFSQWRADEVADDILERVGIKKERQNG